MDDALSATRARYAREIGELAGVTFAPIVEALATVPREAFLGPGPWTVITAGLKPSRTPDANPAHVYHNVLVSLDAAKGLNNGEPRFWAWLFERLRPGAGERVIHVGAGTGYYTALLAEMIGPRGRVTGIEYEPDLAARAKASLDAWPSVELLQGDGLALAEGAADVIVASAGFDAVPLAWVRLLNDGGRLLIPLTSDAPSLAGIGVGAMLLVTRRGEQFAARFAGGVGIYHCMSGRSESAGRRLAEAFGPPPGPGQAWAPPTLGSLRMDDAPDETCWLSGDGWWLSTAPPTAPT